MDDRDKDKVGGAALGGTVGFLIGGPVGAAVGGAIGGAFGSQEEKYNAVTREAFYTLAEQTSASAKLYAAHITPDGAEPGGTGGVFDGMKMEPDIIVSDPMTKNLIIEVETLKGIKDNEQHCLDQLSNFRTRGFKRMLVVPESEIEEVNEWVDAHETSGDINGPELLIASPNRLKGFLDD